MLCLGSVSAVDDEKLNSTLETVNDISQDENIVIDEIANDGNADVASSKGETSSVGVAGEKQNKEILKASDDDILKSSSQAELRDKDTGSTDVVVPAGTSVTVQASMEYDYWYLLMSRDGSSYSTVVQDTGHVAWYDMYTFTVESGTYYFKAINYYGRYGSPSNILTYTVGASKAETETSISVNPTTVAPNNQIAITPSVTKKEGGDAISTGIVKFFYGDGTEIGQLDLSTGTTFDYTGFADEGTYNIYGVYQENDDYTESTSAPVSVLVSQDTSKTPVTVTVTLSDSGVAPGETITITTSVKNSNNDDVTGVVDLYDGNDNLIASGVAIGSPYSYTVSTTSGDYSVYAKYLGNDDLAYAEGVSQKQSYKVKNKLTITLTVDGKTEFVGQVAGRSYDYSSGGYVYSPQYIFYADCGGYAPSLIVYDNDEVVSGEFSGDSNDIELYFSSSETGYHEVYVEFLGDDNYLPCVSNKVTFNIYATGTPRGSLSFNSSAAVEGDKIQITPRVYDYSTSSDLTKGNVTLYSDSARNQEIATIDLGESYDYTVPAISGSSAYGTVYVYARFNGVTENDKMYSSYDFSSSFRGLKKNNLEITGNDGKGEITLNFGDTLTLEALIDYIGSPNYRYENGGYVYYSGIMISYDGDDEWAEFGSTSGGTLQSFDITFNEEGDIGTHTIYAYYEGSSYYAPAKSNVLTVVVKGLAKDTTIALTPSSITVNQGETNMIVPVITADSETVETGTITYYDNDEAISGYSDVSYSTQFNTAGLSVGTHTIKAKYNGGDGYNPSEYSNTVTVIVNEPVNVNVAVTSPTYPAHAVATVTGKSGQSYTLTITETGDTFNVAIPTGETQVTQDLGLLDAGSYHVTVTGEDATAEFTIAKATPTITVTASGNNTGINEAHSITVTSDVEGKITINGESQQYDVGQAIDLTDLKSGSNTINVKLTPNDTTNYENAEKTVTFVIEKTTIGTRIVLEMPTGDSFSYGANSMSVIAHVFDDNDNEISVGTVTFTPGDNYNSASTIAPGASKTISDSYNNMNNGKYTLTVRYNGGSDDDYIYSSSSTSANYYRVSALTSIDLNANGQTELTVYVGDKVTLTTAISAVSQYYDGSDITSVLQLLVDGVGGSAGANPNADTEITITDALLGDHTLAVYYPAENKQNTQTYNYRYGSSTSNEVILHVKAKETPELSIASDKQSYVYGDAITFTPTINVNAGTITWYVNKKENATLAYNENFIINKLAAGENHNVTAVYNANGQYASASATQLVTVLKAQNNVKVEVSENNYLPGDVSIKVTADVDDIYTVTVGEKSVDVKVVSGEGTGVITLPAGEGYVATTTFSDNDNYTVAIEDATFNVLKSENTVKVTVADVTYPGDVTVTVESLVAGEYTIDINGTSVKVTIVSGETSGTATYKFGAGSYYANVTAMPESDDYVNAAQNDTFTVAKALNEASIIIAENNYLPGLVNVQVQGGVKGKYVVSIDGNDYEIEVASDNAIGSKDIALAAKDGYVASLSLDNANYTTTAADVTFNVKKSQNNVKIIIAEDNYLPGDVSVKVTADVDGTYTVTVGEKSVDVKVESGVGTGVIALPAGEGYVATTTFADTDNYDVNIEDATFNVLKSENTVKVTVTGVSYPDDVTVTVESLVAGEYTIDINGTPVKVTIADGQTSGSATYKFGAGSYYANVTAIPSSDIYESVYENTTFSVAKGTNVATIIIAENNYLPGLVNVQVQGGVKGKYVVSIDGNDYEIEVASDGAKGSSDIALAAKDGYVASLSLDNANYTTSSIPIQFNVKKSQNDIKVIIAEDNYLPGDVNVKVTASVDGIYTVTVGNEYSVDVKVVSGEGTGTISLPAGDDYFAVTTFDDWDNYEVSVEGASFNVKKSEIALQIIIGQIVYGNPVSGSIITNVSGTYSIKIGDNAPFTVEAGVGTTPFTSDVQLEARDDAYKAVVSIESLPDYNAQQNDTDFKVVQSETGFKASTTADEYTYGQDAIIAISDIADDATGKITFKYADGKSAGEIADISQLKQLNLGVLAAGQYTIIATYEGDGNYAGGAQRTVTFKVNPKAIDIAVSVNADKYPNDATITVTSDLEGDYVIDINGTDYTVTANGQGLAHKFAAGTYYANITYKNVNYTAKTHNTTFTVEKGVNDIEVTVTPNPVDYGANVTVKVKAGVEGTYTVNINGSPIEIAVDNSLEGEKEVKLNLAVGEYTTQTTWSNANYTIGTLKEATFNVEAIPNHVEFIVENVEYGSDITITVKADRAGTYPIQLRGKHYVDVVVAQDGGTGSATFSADLAAGEYQAATDYENENYTTTAHGGEFSIYPKENKIIVTVDTPLTYGDNVTVKVTAEVAGIYEVAINGNVVAVNVGSSLSGENNTHINLDVAQYTTVTSWSNANYTANITEATFDVVKARNNVEISIDNAEYESEITVNVKADVDAVYAVVINGNTVNVEVKKGQGSSNVKLDLAVDTYQATTGLDNDNYDTKVTGGEFKVYEKTNTVKITVESPITYGDEVTVTVEASVPDTYTITIGDKTVDVKVEGASAEVTVPMDLAASQTPYVATTSWSNANYTLSLTEGSLAVNPKENNVLVEVSDVVLPNVATVNVTADVAGTYRVYLNQTAYVDVEVSTPKTKVSKTIALAEGQYSTSVEFENANYTNKVTNAGFKVSPKPINANLTIRDANQPGKDVITIEEIYQMLLEYKLDKPDADIASDEIIVLASGIEVYRNSTMAEGVYANLGGSFTISEEGTFEFKMIYNATLTNGTVYTKESNTLKVISNIQEQISGIIKIRDADYPNNSTIVINKEDGKVTIRIQYMLEKPSYWMGDEKITFDVGGQTNVITSPKSGEWTGAFQFDLNESAEFTIRAVYTGDDIFTQTAYNENSNTLRYSIIFKANEISMEDAEVDYGTKASIAVSGTDGEYTVSVNGKDYDVTVADGTGVAVIDVLAGNKTYNVNIVSKTDSTLTNSSKLTVKAIDPKLSIDATNKEFVYGNLTTITVDKNGTGNVKVFDGESELTDLTDILLTSGVHTITAKYEADGNFTASEKTITINVAKAVNNINVIVGETILPNQVIVNVTANVDGTYEVIVGGKTVKVTVTAGKGSNATTLPAGENYQANTTWKDDNYDVTIKNATFDVKKGDVELKVIVDSPVIYGNHVTGTVIASAPGTYYVTIGNLSPIEVIVSQTQATFDAGILEVDNYTATVSFNETADYNANSNTTDFTVSLSGTDFKANSTKDTYIYGENIVLSLSLPNDANGKITFTFANGTAAGEITIENGVVTKKLFANALNNLLGAGANRDVSYDLGALDVGTYTVQAKYSGDHNYAESTKTIGFEVVPAQNNIKVEVTPATYGDNVTVKVTADVEGDYVVDINGTDYTVTANGDGKSIKLDAGKYYANVTYNNPNYNANIENTTFEVAKAQNNIKVEVVPSTYPGNVTVKVTADVEGDYVVDINGTDYTVTANGEGKSIKLDAGSYYANVTYVDNNYDGIITNTVFDVEKGVNNVIIASEDTTLPDKVVVNVTADVAGKYTVKIGDKTQEVTISADGATAQATFDLAEGEYTPEIINYVESNYDLSVDASKFVVNPAPVTAQISIRDGNKPGQSTITISEAYGVLLEYNLTRADAEVASEELIVYINGVKLHNTSAITEGAFTNFGGSFTISEAGTYVFTVMYNATMKDGSVMSKTSNELTVVSEIVETPSDVITIRDKNYPSNNTIKVVILEGESFTGLIEYYVNKPSDVFSPEVIFYANDVRVTSIGEYDGLTYGAYASMGGALRFNETGVYKIRAVFHSIAMMWIPEMNENSNTITYDIQVVKKGENLSVSVDNIDYGQRANVTVASSVDGDYIVSVDKDYAVKVINGTGSVLIDVIAAGDYTVGVKSVDNETFANSTKLTVSQIDPNLSIGASNTDFVYGNTTTIRYLVDLRAHGGVKVFDGETELTDLVNIVLAGGVHTITAKYAGDENFTASEKNITINVAQAVNELTLTVTNETYPDNVTITLKATLPGDYTVMIGATPYTVTVGNDGTGVKSVKLNAGNHTASVDYAASQNYSANSAIYKFHVNGTIAGLNITSNATNIELDQSIEFNSSVKHADANGKVTYKSDDGWVQTADIGEAVVYTPTTAGPHKVEVSYDDGVYAPQTITMTVEVAKKKNNIKVEVVPATYPGNVTVKVTADVEGDYVVNINGTDYTVTANGDGKSIKLDAGSYYANVTYVDVNYECITSNTTFDVEKGVNNVIIASEDTTLPDKVVVNVTADVAGKYTVKIGDKTQEVTISADGATAQATFDLAEGEYTPEIINYVESNYDLSVDASKFVVNPAPVTAQISIRDGNKPGQSTITISEAYGVLLEYNLTRADAEVASEELIVYINGVKLHNTSAITEGAFTNFGGSFTISEAGTYVFTVMYNATMKDGSVMSKTSNELTVVSEIVETPSDVITIRDKNYPSNNTIKVVILEGESFTGLIEYYVNKPSDVFSPEVIFYANDVRVTSIGEYDGLTYGAYASMGGALRFNETGVYKIRAVFHSIAMMWIPEMNENSNTITYDIQVVKKGENLSVSVDNIDYGQRANVTVASSVDGDYIVSVDKDYAVKVINGTGSVLIDVIAAGDYTVGVKSVDNETFANSTKLTVSQIDPNLSIGASNTDFVYGNTTTIRYLVDLRAHGGVKVFDGETELTDLVNIVLAGGVHTITAKYAGDENFTASEKNITINVAQAVNELTLTVTNETYPDNVTITLTATLPGDYTVMIGATSYTVTVGNDGTGVKSVKLNVGNHTASVDYAASQNYSANSASYKFHVNGTVAGLNITSNTTSIDYGQSIEFNSSVKHPDANGKVTYKSDDGWVQTADIGEAVVYTPTTAGPHNIEVSYDDGVYAPETITMTVEVAKKKNNVEVSVDASSYPANITVTVNADVDGDYVVDINGTSYTVKVINGTGNVSVLKDAGSYYANVTSTSDEYEIETVNTTFEVKKGIINIVVNAGDVKLPQLAHIEITADKDISFTLKVGDKTADVKVVDGKFATDLRLDAGSYTPEVVYSDANYDVNVTANEFEVEEQNKTVVIDLRDQNYPGNKTIVYVGEDPFESVLEYFLHVPDEIQMAPEINLYINGVHPSGYGIYVSENIKHDEWSGLGNIAFNESGIYKIKIQYKTATLLTQGYDVNSTEITYDITIVEKQKENVTLFVDIKDATYPANATAVVSASEDGNYTVNVNGKDYSVEVINGSGSVVLDVLDANKYNATVMSNVNSTLTNTSEFTVNKGKNNIVIEASDVTLPQNATLIVRADLPGTYTVVIGNTTLDVKVDGIGMASIALPAGKYTATVDYIGTNYEAVVTPASFEVTQAPIVGNLSIRDAQYPSNVTVSVEGDGNVTITVEYYIEKPVLDPTTEKLEFIINGNVSYVVDEVVNGSYVKVVFTFNETADLAISANYSAWKFMDKEYSLTSNTLNYHIFVNEVLGENVTMSVQVKAPSYPENATVIVKSTTDGNYTVSVNGKQYPLEVVNGSGRVVLDVLDAGTYNVTVISDTNATLTNSSKFTVNKGKNNIVVEVSDVTLPQNATVVVKADVAGTYTVIIGNRTLDIEVDGMGSSTIELAPGQYTANVNYTDANYDVTITPASFKVSEAPLNGDLTIRDAQYPQNVTVTLEGDGNVTITVEYYIEKPVLDPTTEKLEFIVNGNVSYVVDEVVNGSYVKVVFTFNETADLSISANYSAWKFMDKEYSLASNTLNYHILVNEAIDENTTLSVDASDVSYGDKAQISVKSQKDGNYTVTVGDKNYTVEVINGTGSVEVDALPAGEYDVKVFDNDTLVNSTKLNVGKASDYPINASVEDGKLIINVPSDSNGNITVKILDKTYTPAIENGKAVLDISNIKGENTAEISFTGDDNYEAKNITAQVNVADRPVSKISIVSIDSDFTMGGVLSNIYGKPIANATVRYVINGVENKVTTSDDGSFSIAGVKGVKVYLYYDGDDASMPFNTSITVKDSVKTRTSTVILGNNFTQYAIEYNSGERGQNFTVQLRDIYGNVLANKTVLIGYNGKTLYRTTDENGYANVQINLKDKNRLTFAVTFLGDKDYKATMSVYLITIVKKPVTMTASAKTYKVSAKSKKYTVSLKTIKGASADGKVYFAAGKKVTLKVNGKTYAAKTNAKGQATFNLNKLTKKGVYNAVISYAGSTTYDAVSKKVKLTVK